MSAVLYSFRRCPYAMRARMALHVSGEDYEHREILLRNKPAAMLAASPKGTVPVFVLDDGRVIDESYDLMLWALAKNDPEGWLAPGEARMRPLIETITGDFKHHLDRYKYASRYDDNTARGAVNESHREAALDMLAPLEVRLKTSAYLMGESRSLADIAVFPFIRQFAATEPHWWAGLDKPELKAWLKTLISSPLFKAVMKKHELWQAS